MGEPASASTMSRSKHEPQAQARVQREGSAFLAKPKFATGQALLEAIHGGKAPSLTTHKRQPSTKRRKKPPKAEHIQAAEKQGVKISADAQEDPKPGVKPTEKPVTTATSTPTRNDENAPKGVSTVKPKTTQEKDTADAKIIASAPASDAVVATDIAKALPAEAAEESGNKSGAKKASRFFRFRPSKNKAPKKRQRAEKERETREERGQAQAKRGEKAAKEEKRENCPIERTEC